MNHISDFTGKPVVQLIREMRCSEVLDMATDAYFMYLKRRNEKTCEDYNWWVDVYNFKRGKRVLKTLKHNLVKIVNVK